MTFPASAAPKTTTIAFFASVDDAYTDGREFDGFSAGTFVDMWGRELTILPEELPIYVLNTARAIEATRDSSGSPVGLPIDIVDHVPGDGAGFMVAVTQDPGATVLRFTPRWTDIGVDILSRGLRRWFSATFDFVNKVILGGTLTNWPATRDSMGRILLRPIELSSGLYRITEPKGDSPMPFDLNSLTAEDRASLIAALTPDIRAAVIADLGGQRDGETAEQVTARLRAAVSLPDLTNAIDLSEARDVMTAAMSEAVAAEYKRLQASMGAQLAGLMAQMQKAQHIAEFSARLTTGSAATPRALPVKATDLEAALSAMPDPARVQMERILEAVVAGGLVDFAEVGRNGTTEAKRPVPEWAAQSLRDVVAAGNSPEAFFAMAGLGSANEYDLSGFVAPAAK